MVTFLHSNYVSSLEEYEAASDYWRRLCEGVLQDLNQQQLWKPWLRIHQERQPSNIEEGAIWSLYSEAQNKAVNIEQYLPKKSEVEIFATIDRFGEGALEIPVDYLTICCALSTESAAIAKELIRVWASPQVTPTAMAGVIDKLIP